MFLFASSATEWRKPIAHDASHGYATRESFHGSMIEKPRRDESVVIIQCPVIVGPLSPLRGFCRCGHHTQGLRPGLLAFATPWLNARKG